MAKFKVGDKVRSNGSLLFSIGKAVVTVSSVTEDGRYFTTNDSAWKEYQYPMYGFELVEAAITHFPLYSESEAVKLLSERGYAVTPPPKPLKGKVYIYNFPQLIGGKGSIHAKTAQQFAESDWVSEPNILAIVNWTEGQGLEKGS